MSVRETLIEILSVPIYPHLDADPAEVVADYLIDNGVTVQKRGQWIAQDEGRTRFMCSVCKAKNYQGHENYCPSCGANMNGKAGG